VSRRKSHRPKPAARARRVGSKDWTDIKHFEESVMQLVITAIAVIAGMTFSLAIALLVEEFIFGEVFRLFFARQAVRVKAEQKH